MLKGFPFSTREKKPTIRVLASRIAIGYTAAAVIFLSLRLILPGNESLWQGIPYLEDFYELGRFIRYGLFGFWVSAGAPRIFQHLGIAEDTFQAEEG